MFFRGVVVTVRHVLLAASTGTEAADAGKAAEQERADRMERAVTRGGLSAGVVSRVRGRQPEDDHQGDGEDESAGRRSGLEQGESRHSVTLARPRF